MSRWPFCVGGSLEGGGGWKALQYGDSMTNSACVAMAPTRRLESSGEDDAREWYCESWLVLSRSHSALMSPVTMNECVPNH